MAEGAILDPVASKELGGLARRWQTYAFRMAYVGIIGFILARNLVDPELWRNVQGLSISEFAQLSREVFQHFFWMNLLLVATAAVAGAVESVHRERRAGTLGLLLLSPLSPLGIALGKWKAAVFQAASLLLCGVPVLGTCFFLGGIGPFDLVWSVSLTLAMAALGAAFGLLFAPLRHSPSTAILLSFLALAATSFFGVFFLPCGEALPAVASLLHPIYAAAGALDPYGRGGFFEHGWILASPVTIGVAYLLVRWSAGWIEECGLQAAESIRRADDFAFLRGWFGMKRASGGVWDAWPLLWKELATRTAGRMDAEIRFWILVLLCFGVPILWVPSAGKSASSFAVIATLFLGIATFTGASLFTRDREGRALEVLASTPLTPWHIVRTKLLAGLLAPESLPVLALWPVTLFGWGYWAAPAEAFVFAGTATLHLAFTYLLAAAASLGSRSVRRALLVAGGCQVALLFVLPFVLRMAWPSARDGLVATLLAAHPPEIVTAFFWRQEARQLLEGFIPYLLAWPVAAGALLLGMVRGLRRAAA